MSKEYGLVLIGCGHIGAVHLEDIYFRENVKLIGVVDTNEKIAKMFMKKYSAQSYSTDYHDYLEREDVDIIIIATYVSTHLSILKDCLAHNKHVLCEKPISGNYDEAMEFVDCVKNTKSKVLIGHILRHNDSYNKIAAMIDEDLIGKPIVMRMVQNHHTMNWDRYKKLLKDCSPIIDCGVHYVDVMQWFTKAKVISVSGIGARLEDDIDKDSYNYGMIQARLSDGSIAYYEAGWSNSTASENVKEFIGPKGRIKLTLSSERTTHKEEGDLIEYYETATQTYYTINMASKYKSTFHQLMTLIEMIEKDYAGNPTIDDVLSVVKVVFAADKAIKEGKTINLSYDTQDIIKNN